MSRATHRQSTNALAAGLIVMLFAGCAATPSGPEVSSTPPASASVTPSVSVAPSPSVAAAPTDLDQLDAAVREHHVSPFTIHSQAEWEARLEEIRPEFADASPDEQFVLVSSLVGLLDTHSYLIPNGGFHAYEVLFYKFSDGWFTVAAKDDTLIGSRLVSIDGHPIDDVESTLRPLIAHDNETGFLDSGEGAFSYVEYLHGTGIVADPAKPQYVLERPDGTQVTVDFPAVDEGTWADELKILGDLIGDAPEAVARRGELAWTRLDKSRKVILLSVNDYGDMSAASAAVTAALDAGDADRVVLDIRYLRGGSGDFRLLDVLKGDSRVNRPGGLTVLMGRENVSVATLIDYEFDVHTAALLVGEPTPARADNFRCECHDIVLARSGILVSVPTDMSHNGDLRPEIAPDVPMSLSSADFFAGRDPVLDAAMEGITAP